MKIPFDPIQFKTIWLCSDLESLSKITFVKIIEEAKKTYRRPKDFFLTLGISIPPRVKDWDDIEEYFLIQMDKIIYKARRHTKLKAIIVTSKGKIIEHED